MGVMVLGGLGFLLVLGIIYGIGMSVGGAAIEGSKGSKAGIAVGAFFMAGGLFTVFGCAVSFFLVPLLGTPTDRFFSTWVAWSLGIGAFGGIGAALLVATEKDNA